MTNPEAYLSSNNTGNAQMQMSADNSKITFTNLAPGESITMEYKNTNPFGSMLVTYTLIDKNIQDLILQVGKTNLKIGEKTKLTAKIIPEGSAQ